MANYYYWFKAFHLIAVICWMIGILYLPRLYVYHSRVEKGSEADRIFQLMEYRLLKIIMNPAMIFSYVFGLINAYFYGFSALGVWFYIKIAAVGGLTIMHGFLAKWRKDFAANKNQHSEKFYRTINEVPTIFMIIAIIMVIVKPFE